MSKHQWAKKNLKKNSEVSTELFRVHFGEIFWFLETEEGHNFGDTVLLWRGKLQLGSGLNSPEYVPGEGTFHRPKGHFHLPNLRSIKKFLPPTPSISVPARILITIFYILRRWKHICTWRSYFTPNSLPITPLPLKKNKLVLTTH